MTTIPYEEVDYLNEARERVTYQFQDKDIFDRYLQLLIKEQDNLQKMFKDMLQLRYVDTAFGGTLDVIGNIVGQERTPLPGELFGTEGFVIPDDETYRLLIKAKIIKNNTDSAPESVIYGVEFVLGVDGVTIQEGKDASYIVYVPRYLSDLEKYLIAGVVTEYYTYTLLPKPVGVRVEFVEFDGTNFFAFVGVPNARGFGEFVGTAAYGIGYGEDYGVSDYAATDGGIFANFIEVN